MARIHAELIPKVKELCRKSVGVEIRQALTSGAGRAASTKQKGLPERVDVVAIGTSTGGPNALAAMLPALAGEFPVPIVVVQHMPPLFTRLLAERPDKQASLAVHEGGPGQIVMPGHAWIAPGDFHMKVAQKGMALRLEMNQEAPQHSCRPAVDVPFALRHHHQCGGRLHQLPAPQD